MREAASVILSAIVRRRWESGTRSIGPHCSKLGSGGISTATGASGRRAGAASRAAGGGGGAGAPPPAGGGAAGGGGGNSGRGVARGGAHVIARHSPARARWRDTAEIDAELAGQPPRRRGGGDGPVPA